MKYKKSKLRLNEIRDFYFLVIFDLILIYILKVYRKKSSSILLRKNMFNSLLTFFFWKACTFLRFENFSFENLETTPSTFLSKLSSEIYLSRIINYWGSILYYNQHEERSVWFVSIHIFFFLLFFSFSISIFLDRHKRFKG